MKVTRLISIFSLLMTLNACGTDNKESDDNGAHELFDKSALKIIEMSSLIALAEDTVQIDSLLRVLDKNLTDINFSFPPVTDLGMTEQENDSLYRLLKDLKLEITKKRNEINLHLQDTIQYK